MKKFIAALAATAVVVGGGIATSVLSAPGTALAQTTEDSTTTDESAVERSAGLTSILDDLVTEGVITQAQADTVAERLTEQGFGRFGQRGHRGGGSHLDELAAAIGIDEATLQSGLADGQTLSEIAVANGVEPQAVVDALTADMQTMLDAAVADGRITQEEADAKAAEAATRIEGIVDGTIEFGGRGFGRGHHGHGQDGATEDTDAVESSFSA